MKRGGGSGGVVLAGCCAEFMLNRALGRKFNAGVGVISSLCIGEENGGGDRLWYRVVSAPSPLDDCVLSSDENVGSRSSAKPALGA